MKPGDKYYDGPIVDSGRTVEEIEQDIEEEKKRIENIKWTPDMLEEQYHQSEIGRWYFCIHFLSERKGEKVMMKAMLSQPIAGKTDEEIKETRENAIKALKEKGYEIVNTLFTDEWYSKENMEQRGVVQIPLCFLAKSLENMSLCHAAYFCKGWEKARGCRIEHDAAVAYGLDVIYEE